MENRDNLIQCYNRGCGQKYDPTKNAEAICRHHPGAPFFHDAYKGWSCCKKKCTDFTEFLNIKGCMLSVHSNVKPPEPEKPVLAETEEVIEIAPLVPSKMKRPALDTPMIKMQPQVAATLKQQLENVKLPLKQEQKSDEISLGTICKNGGCNISYEGPMTDSTPCIHHPGCPIFHEGLKFWSCCQKRTTDFNAFLNQEGCERGTHLWKREENTENVQCRWDWHQTVSHVVVSVYAKLYCPEKSLVELNPIRMHINLIFPQQNNAFFDLNIELRGIINIQECQVSMFGTKIEVKLKKAEAGSWTKLHVEKEQKKTEKKEIVTKVEALTPKVDAVDLSDL